MSNIEPSLKFYVNEKDLDYRDRQLHVTGEDTWYFKGATILEKSGSVEEKEGDRPVAIKHFFSTEYTWVRANGDAIPDIRTTYSIYRTEGGSYIACKSSNPGVCEAKIIETTTEIKAFFGNKELSKELYQGLVKLNSHLASSLLGGYMKVIK